MVRFEPYGKRIVVKMLPNEKKSAAGIIIPGKENVPSNKAKIVAVSEESSKDFKVDDIVIIDTYAGAPTDPDDDKREVRIIKTDDVWAKVIED